MPHYFQRNMSKIKDNPHHKKIFLTFVLKDRRNQGNHNEYTKLSQEKLHPTEVVTPGNIHIDPYSQQTLISRG